MVRRFPATGSIDRRIDRSIWIVHEGRATDVRAPTSATRRSKKKKRCRSVGCCKGDIEWINGRRAGCCERSQSNQMTSQCQLGACVGGKSTSVQTDASLRAPSRRLSRRAGRHVQHPPHLQTCGFDECSGHVSAHRQREMLSCQTVSGVGPVRGVASGEQQTTPHRRARTHARTRARAHARTHASTYALMVSPRAGSRGVIMLQGRHVSPPPWAPRAPRGPRPAAARGRAARRRSAQPSQRAPAGAW